MKLSIQLTVIISMLFMLSCTDIVRNNPYDAESVAGLNTPKDLKAIDITPTSLTLVWMPVRGASFYKVFKSKEKISIRDTIETNIIKPPYNVKQLLPDTEYWFVVKAYNKYGNTSPASTFIKVKTKQVINN